MEVDNLKMDMSGVELSVANAHRQIQRVEDEVVVPLSKKVSDMYQDFFTSGGAMESRFNGTLEEHHERLNAVELGNARAAEKCDSVREVLTSWMITFEALEGNVGKCFDNTNLACDRIKDLEDWLEPNSRSIVRRRSRSRVWRIWLRTRRLPSVFFRIASGSWSWVMESFGLA
jgi:hypothetical protein